MMLCVGVVWTGLQATLVAAAAGRLGVEIDANTGLECNGVSVMAVRAGVTETSEVVTLLVGAAMLGDVANAGVGLLTRVGVARGVVADGAGLFVALHASLFAWSLARFFTFCSSVFGIVIGFNGKHVHFSLRGKQLS